MSSMIPNPMTSAGTIAAPPTDDPNYAIPDIQALNVPAGYGLPMTIDSMIQGGAPSGAYADSQYYADEAALRSSIASQYSDLLQQLGYQSPGGAVIPGRLVQDANIQLAQYQKAMQDAARNVVQNAQQTGTIFSGARADALANAQYPISQNIGQLNLSTTRGLADLYAQAQKLASQYDIQNNQLLASAAARQAAALMALPPSTTPGGGGYIPPIQTGPILTGNETPTDLQGSVSTPNAGGVFPGTSETPVAISGTPAPPGGLSANSVQGVFGVDLGNMDYPTNPQLAPRVGTGVDVGFPVHSYTDTSLSALDSQRLASAAQRSASTGFPVGSYTDASLSGGYGPATPIGYDPVTRTLAGNISGAPAPVAGPILTSPIDVAGANADAQATQQAIQDYQAANPYTPPDETGGISGAYQPSSQFWKDV